MLSIAQVVLAEAYRLSSELPPQPGGFPAVKDYHLLTSNDRFALFVLGSRDALFVYDPHEAFDHRAYAKQICTFWYGNKFYLKLLWPGMYRVVFNVV